MNITLRRDVDAPQDAVFAALSNFERWESQARASGVSLSRLDPDAGLGTAWRVVADFKGLRRRFVARIVACHAPDRLDLALEGDGMSALIPARIVPRGAGTSTLLAEIDMRPETLKARLMVQSLRFARGALIQRLDRALAQFATTVEARHPARG